MISNGLASMRVPSEEGMIEVAGALSRLLRQIASSHGAEVVVVHGVAELEIDPEFLCVSSSEKPDDSLADCISHIASCFRDRRAANPVSIAHLDEEGGPARIPSVLKSKVKSAAVIPLELASASNASLVILWLTEKKQPSEGEMESMASSARLIGILCKSIMVMMMSREQAKRLSALVELSTTIYSTLNYQIVLQKVVNLATSFVSASYATIYLLTPDGSRLKTLLTNARSRRDSIMGSDLIVGKGPEGRAAAQGEGVIVNGLPAGAEGGGLEQGSRIAVPLISSGNTIGVLCVHRDTGDLFTLEDLQFVSIFARQAADVIENARLFRDLQRAYNRLSRTQQQMMETEKLRALGEMACGVAHDFNNRLGAILGRAQVLQRRVSDQQVLEGLLEIEDLALKGAETVRRTQEFARIRTRTVKERVLVNEVVRDAVETTKPIWKDQAQLNLVEIDLVTELTATSPIAGSFGELVDALSNIIQNSVEAMPNGGTITIKTYDQSGEVVIEVSDTGVGMSAQTRERMFYPFFSTRGKGKTGLGLSVAYGILTRHQAAVDVVTEEGKGTRIGLIFPARPELAQRDKKRKVAATAGNLRILLVDDDESLLIVVSELLAILGHSAVTAAEGIEALAKFDNTAFDLVITDLGLPGMSGWDIAKAVKLRNPDMPVMIISGWGAQIGDSDIKSQGVDLVLPKPFTVAQLEEAISTVLGIQAADAGRSETPAGSR